MNSSIDQKQQVASNLKLDLLGQPHSKWKDTFLKQEYFLYDYNCDLQV